MCGRMASCSKVERTLWSLSPTGHGLRIPYIGSRPIPVFDAVIRYRLRRRKFTWRDLSLPRVLTCKGFLCCVPVCLFYFFYFFSYVCFFLLLPPPNPSAPSPPSVSLPEPEGRPIRSTVGSAQGCEGFTLPSPRVPAPALGHRHCGGWKPGGEWSIRGSGGGGNARCRCLGSRACLEYRQQFLLREGVRKVEQEGEKRK